MTSIASAQRLKRVFGVHIETCPACGGQYGSSRIEDAEVIEKILTYLDAKAAEPEAPRLLAWWPARGELRASGAVVGRVRVLKFRPGYLCCGYPQTSAGLAAKGQHITTQNRVLFHRVTNTLNYMDIRTVIVSCGTCMD